MWVQQILLTNEVIMVCRTHTDGGVVQSSSRVFAEGILLLLLCHNHSCYTNISICTHLQAGRHARLLPCTHAHALTPARTLTHRHASRQAVRHVHTHTHTHTHLPLVFHMYLRPTGGDLTPTKPATDAVRYGAAHAYTWMCIVDRALLRLASTNVTCKAKLSAMLYTQLLV